MYSVNLTQTLFRFLPCLLVAGAAAHAQTTWYVDDDGDPANGCTSWVDACPDLQTALGLTISGDEIWVATGTYKPTPGTDRTATLQLITGVALYGGFDGTETSLGQRAGLFDQTILTGDLNGDDAAVACTQDSPDCDSYGGLCVETFCIIKQNNGENSYQVVTGSGTDATAVIDGFTITGGSGASYGGGMYNYMGSPTVTNCTFTGNTADKGGGMSNREFSAPTITNCTFSGNMANMEGGGLYNYASHSTLTNCTFSGNTAYDGGGMRNWQSSPMVTDCTFTGNTATNDGGGINNYLTSHPSVTNCTFSGNSAIDGAGMYNYTSSPTVANCAFTDNMASAAGGGMYNFSSANPTVTNCTFSINWADWYGGGMHNDSSSPAVTNCTFADNLIGAAGCGMRNNFNSNPTVTNCIFWGHPGSEISDYLSAPSVTYSNVHGGYAGTGNIDADPYFRDAAGGDLRLNCFSLCVDAGSNAAVPGGVTTDLDCNARFVDDTGVVDTGAGTPPIVDMGAYERQIPSLGTLYVDVANCPGPGWGTPGDPYCSIQDAIDAAGVAKDAVEVAPGIYNEAIDFLGKAIMLVSTGGRDVTIIDATGLSTSVVTCASGEGADTILDGFTITGGTGTDPGDGYLRGGGMYIDASSPTVTNCTLTANTGTFGIGMYNGGGSPTVTNCTFSLNSGHSGGGMFNDGGSPVVSNCLFTQNGVHGIGSTGGGMYNGGGSTPAVINCKFYSNWGGYAGGGMRNESANPTVTNCTFNANHGVYWGRAMSNIGSNPTVTNCILWGNTGGGGEIYNSGSSPTVTYSDVQGGTGQPWFGTGCIDADPLFVAPSSGDLRLQPSSPCVDMGDDTAVPLDTLDVDSDGDTSEPTPDLNGKPRIIDGDADSTPTVDMGASEYYPDCNENEVPDVCDTDCTALGGACNLPGCGLSTECNTNGIPDDCDIAGCTSGSPDYAGCDDCNLNSVPDSCDIAGGTSQDENLDEVPDECVTPNTTAGDWTDDVWGLSGDYPDNQDSEPDLHVTLDTTQIFLDESVEIESLRLIHGATLSVTQVAAGDLDIVTAGGIHNEGTIFVSNDRAIDVPNGSVTMTNGGRYIADPLAVGTNSASLTASSIALFGGDCDTFSSAAEMVLDDAMSATVSGDLTVQGPSTPSCSWAGSAASDGPASALQALAPPTCDGNMLGSASFMLGVILPPKLNNCGSSVTTIGGDIRFSGAVLMVNEVLDHGVALAGNLDNQSTVPSLFNWSAGGIVMNGTSSQTFEVAGLDLGQTAEGFYTNQDTLFDKMDHTNFSVGVLEVAPGRSVTLTNQFTNSAGVGVCTEALYVHDLVLDDNATLTVDNCTVYYDTLTIAETAILTTVGCGELACLHVADPPTQGQYGKNRHLSITGGNPGRQTAIRVTLAGLPTPFNALDGRTLWAGQPIQVCERSGQGLNIDPRDDPPNGCGFAGNGLSQDWFWAAPLVCDAQSAHYLDWTTLAKYCNAPDSASNAEPCDDGCPDGSCNMATDVCEGGAHDGQPCCPGGTCGVDGIVHLYHEGIVPTHVDPVTLQTSPGTYHIQAIDSTCQMTAVTSYSPVLEVTQSRYGDVVTSAADCPNAAPDGHVSMICDTLALIDKYQNVGCPVQKARADLRGALGPDLDFKIDMDDILETINAFQGYVYPFGSGQCVSSLCSGGLDHGAACQYDADCASDPCPPAPSYGAAQR